MSAMRLLLLCVAFICLSDLTSGAILPRQPNCPLFKNINCQFPITMCGSDGRTYSNICAFCNAKQHVTSPLSIVKYGAC